jgi:hypothetical protein
MVANNRALLHNVTVRDADSQAIAINASGLYARIKDCIIEDADSEGIQTLGPDTQIIGNHIINSAGYGISAHTTGDRPIIMGNHVGSASSIQVTSSIVDALVVGNVYDGTLSFTGTGTNANNEQY